MARVYALSDGGQRASRIRRPTIVGSRRAWVASLLAHGAALVALPCARLPSEMAAIAPHVPVEIEVRRPPPPAQPAFPAAMQHPMVAPQRRHVASQHPVSPRAPQPSAPPAKREVAPAPPAAPAPSSSTGGGGRGGGDRAHTAPDLFPSGLLGTLAGSGPAAPQGRTRRAGDGLPQPGARDAAADREQAAATVHGWMRDAVGEAEVEGGRIDPVWRSAERGVAARWHPRPPEISDENPTYTWLKQWQHARPPTVGRPTDGAARAIDPSAISLDQLGQDQFAAAQQALSEPAEWRRTLVEVVVAADGAIVSIRVASPSGRRGLDRVAVAAVEGALTHDPVRDPRGRVVARFAVEAAVVAPPPPLLPVMGPGGTVVGAAVDVVGIIKRVVRRKEDPKGREARTRVRLLSVVPAD